MEITVCAKTLYHPPWSPQKLNVMNIIVDTYFGLQKKKLYLQEVVFYDLTSYFVEILVYGIICLTLLCSDKDHENFSSVG